MDSTMHAAAGGSPSVASTVIRGLSVEHSDFVDRLAVAPTLLPPSERNLGEMLAFQARLTRRFFDLQRQLLDRCAVLDAQVAAIDAAAASAALGDELFPISTLGVGNYDPSAFAVDEVRQALAALAAVVVTTPDDVVFLSKVLDDAFVPDEFPFSSVLGEFGEVFDHCWRETNRVAELRLADAQARAAMLLHFARVEDTAWEAPAATPTAGVQAVESAEEAAPSAQRPVDLDALLAQFDDALELEPALRWADDQTTTDSRSEVLIDLGAGESGIGEEFWEQSGRKASGRRRLPTIPPSASSSAAAFVVAVAALLRLK